MSQSRSWSDGNERYFNKSLKTGGIREFHAFPKVISLKVNVIVQLEFKCLLDCESPAFYPLHHRVHFQINDWTILFDTLMEP